MRIRSALAAAAVLLGTAGAALGASPALASDNANVVQLYSNGTPNSPVNNTCNGAQTQTDALNVGFANYHLDGTTMTVIVHLKDAVPNTTYNLSLWEGFCAARQTDPNNLTLTTNDKGLANAVATFANVQPGGNFWVFLYQFTPGLVLVNSAAVTP